MEDFLMKELSELGSEIGSVEGATDEDREEMAGYLDGLKAEFFEAMEGGM